MKLIFGLLVSMLSVNCAAQLDTAKLIMNSKMRMMPLVQEYENTSYYIRYLIDYKPRIDFLDSKGFEKRFIFYKVLAKDTSILKDTVKIGTYEYHPFFRFINGYVYFCFDMVSHRIYSLSGLKNNDFDMFFRVVTNYYNTVNATTITATNFYLNFWISEVNLECLCKKVEKSRSQKCYKVVEPFYHKNVFE